MRRSTELVQWCRDDVETSSLLEVRPEETLQDMPFDHQDNSSSAQQINKKVSDFGGFTHKP
jgi:hypothetical protein